MPPAFARTTSCKLSRRCAHPLRRSPAAGAAGANAKCDSQPLPCPGNHGCPKRFGAGSSHLPGAIDPDSLIKHPLASHHPPHRLRRSLRLHERTAKPSSLPLVRVLVGEPSQSATELADPLVDRSPGPRDDLGFFRFSRPANDLRPAPHPTRTLSFKRVAPVLDCNQGVAPGAPSPILSESRFLWLTALSG